MTIFYQTHAIGYFCIAYRFLSASCEYALVRCFSFFMSNAQLTGAALFAASKPALFAGELDCLMQFLRVLHNLCINMKLVTAIIALY